MFKNFLSSLVISGFIFSALTLTLPVFTGSVYAQATPVPAPATSTAKPAEDKNFATSPARCGSDATTGKTPRNCLFLEEPIGGRSGYDLYIEECINGKKPPCQTTLWSGGAVPTTIRDVATGKITTQYRGPLQAILTEEKDKAYQGPFGLLYGYLSLIYNYMSGLIVGVAVLFVVVGGVQMTTSGGQDAGITAGKDRIKKALIGLVLWFLASLVLYTINPTFFTF